MKERQAGRIVVPLAKDKCQGPCTCLAYLGFELDSILMQVRLPAQTLAQLIALLESWEGKKACTKHELDSLIGNLQHVTAVVGPGCSFLWRMIQLAKRVVNPKEVLRLNVAFRNALAWWGLFIRRWNGISLMSALGQERPNWMVTSDASGNWGCGAFCGDDWFQLEWNTELRKKSIAVQELIPIILAGMAWGHAWRGGFVLCRCDNAAMMAILKSQYSRDEDLMHLLCCLFFPEAAGGSGVLAQHIPGVHNELADNLSRIRACTTAAI